MKQNNKQRKYTDERSIDISIFMNLTKKIVLGICGLNIVIVAILLFLKP